MASGLRQFATWSKLLRRMIEQHAYGSLSPPVDRSMHVLDRSFFKKVVPLAAASVFDNKDLARVRDELVKSKDVFNFPPIKPLRPDETSPGRKCLLLRPEISPSDLSTWTPTITNLVEKKTLGMRSYDLTMTYGDWTMHDILEATLPEFPENEKETPAGFSHAGHVAHVNLRSQYLPYKHLIGQVLIDKNPNIRTVINKTEDVGAESVYRTFPYEVLAGPDDMNVILSESDCVFKFDFAKVYWNSRLNTEHRRLFEKFKEGETVCDVMAGVGPFAVPAGKKNVFVWANDLNPNCFEALTYAIRRNKVDPFVNASCTDGRAFIRSTTNGLPDRRRKAVIKAKQRRHVSDRISDEILTPTVREIIEPATFDHYVMNLPATAVEFLDAFKGIYAGRQDEFQPHADRLLPLIHLYCFSPRMDTDSEELDAVCEMVSNHLGYQLRANTPDVEVRDVRLVSPKKKMFCASFRLPPEVAFAN